MCTPRKMMNCIILVQFDSNLSKQLRAVLLTLISIADDHLNRHCSCSEISAYCIIFNAIDGGSTRGTNFSDSWLGVIGESLVIH